MKTGDSTGINAQPGLKPTNQRYVLAAILFFTLLVAYLDRVNVSVLVADTNFLNDFGIAGNPVQMGMLMSVFLAAYGLGNVILSPLGDVYGPRKAMCFSIALWTISMFIGGMVTVFSMMLISRVVLGLGEGLHWPMQSNTRNASAPWCCAVYSRHDNPNSTGCTGGAHRRFFRSTGAAFPLSFQKESVWTWCVPITQD